MEKKCMLARQEPKYRSIADVPAYLRGSHREVGGAVWYVCAIAGKTAQDLAGQLPPDVVAKNTHVLWFDADSGRNDAILGKPVPFHFTAGRIELLETQEQVASVAAAVVASTIVADAGEAALRGTVSRLQEENRRLADENAALEARRAELLKEIESLMSGAAPRGRKSSKQ